MEAAVGPDLARAATVRDLVRAAAAAGERLRRLGAFDAVSITLDAAPPVLPGKYGGGGGVVVLVDIAEACDRIAGDLGVFTNTEEFDLRVVALPLGVSKGALNARVAAGVIHPLARVPTGSISSLPERFYLGGNRSLVCRLGRPSSLLDFKARGLGPTDLRTCSPNNSENGASTSHELDAQGADVALTAFGDLSFDLPLKPLRELGIHGHAFVSAGNLAKLTERDLWRVRTNIQEFCRIWCSCANQIVSHRD